MPVILAELTPYDPVTGTRPVLRASSAQDRRVTGLNGSKWWPAISGTPTRSIRLFDGDFSSDVDPGEASLVCLLDKLLKADANVLRYQWAAAKLTYYVGEHGDAWPWVVAFRGIVSRFEGDGSRQKLTAQVDTEPFEVDALAAKYAGTGGAEGDANLKNKPKPWLFGRCLSAEPVLINAVDNVFQFSAYGPIQAVNALYERASDFGASVGDYASYAALVAATIPAGQWGTCLAQGMIRLGAPAYGVITGDVDGDKPSAWLRKTGEIIQRIASNAGIDAALVDSVSLDSLDTALTAALPNDGRIGFYLTEQASVLDVVRRLVRPCNAQAGVSWLGKLFAVRVAIGAPAITLDAQGRRLPAVTNSVEVDVSAPYWRIEMGAQRCWREHSFDEIAFFAQLVESGTWSGSETYREGNIVQDQSSSWLYINTTATSGNAPPTLPTTANAWWRVMASGSKLISLEATHSTFGYNAAGTVQTQSTTFAAARQNTAVATSWKIYKADGTSLIVGPTTAALLVSNSYATSSSDNDHLTINQTKFDDLIVANSTSGLVVEALFIDGASTFSARRSVAKVEDGATGTTVALVGLGTGTYELIGSVFTKTATNATFDVAISGPGYAGALYAKMDVNPANIYSMVGFDTSPTTFTRANTKYFVQYNYSLGTLDIYVNGTSAQALTGLASIAGEIVIVRDRLFFRCFVGGVERGTPVALDAADAAATTYPKWIGYNTGTYTGLDCGIAGSNALFSQVTLTAPLDPTIQLTSAGAVVTGQLPKTVARPGIYRNGASIATADNTSYAIQNKLGALGTVTIDNTNGSATKGQSTIPSSGTTGAGSYEILVTVDGVALTPIKITVNVEQAPPTSGGGSGSKIASTTVNEVLTSTSYAQVGGTMTVTKAAGETMRGTFGGGYAWSYTASGQRYALMKWQYVATGAGWGSPTDFGAAVSGSNSDFDVNTFESSPASITCNQNVAPADGTYDVRLVAAMSASNGNLAFDGSLAYINVAV